jgi:predicted PurR-regulated permease PerM
MLVASIVAMLSGEPVLARVAGVIILYLSQKLFEATVLGPKIVGGRVGLHPVLLILCLLVFGYFLGFMGLLIAVPATALVVETLREWEGNRTAPLPVPAEE